MEADAARAQEVAVHLGLVVERVDPVERAADELAEGKVVAWVRGRAEWGPRALGHRSLLARADDVGIRDELNRRIKGREPFRPFAPAVLSDRAPSLLEDAPSDMTPFMAAVCRVREGAALAGATHVDGTARAQTVGLDDSLAPLLKAVAQRGMDGLLNTSLNAAGEPLVARVTDALDFFVRRKPDVLYVEDVRITRP